jgi:hypothetical protein
MVFRVGVSAHCPRAKGRSTVTSQQLRASAQRLICAVGCCGIEGAHLKRLGRCSGWDKWCFGCRLSKIGLWRSLISTLRGEKPKNCGSPRRFRSVRRKGNSAFGLVVYYTCVHAIKRKSEPGRKNFRQAATFSLCAVAF